MQRPNKAFFIAQSHRVESWAALRAERAPEILAQLSPQIAFWSSIIHLNPGYTPYTHELLSVAVEYASHVVQQTKFLAVCPRPSDFSPRIQPMFDAPAFFAWPSGHATQAFMVAELLTRLLVRDPVQDVAAKREMRLQLWRQADRIATNRIVAGLHFPVDNEAGCALGITLAEDLVLQSLGQPGKSNAKAVAAGTPSYPSIGPNEDFDYRAMRDKLCGDETTLPTTAQPKFGGDIATPLQWLWAQAFREWHAAGDLPHVAP